MSEKTIRDQIALIQEIGNGLAYGSVTAELRTSSLKM